MGSARQPGHAEAQHAVVGHVIEELGLQALPVEAKYGSVVFLAQHKKMWFPAFFSPPPPQKKKRKEKRGDFSLWSPSKLNTWTCGHETLYPWLCFCFLFRACISDANESPGVPVWPTLQVGTTPKVGRQESQPKWYPPKGP